MKVQGLERCLGIMPGLLLLLAGCASTGPAPVRDLGLGGEAPVSTREPAAQPRIAPGHYRVQRGDTLYSIAFRNGLDYREVAAWNGIRAPYTIRAGEELRLTAPAARVASSVSPPTSSQPTSTVPKPASAPTPTPFQPVAPAAAPTPDSTSVGATTSAAAVTAASVPSSTPDTTLVPAPASAARPTPAEPTAARTTSGELIWRWPADGKLVGTFAAGDPVRQGIDIAGSSGDPVRAAAAGTVVYSGNGLIGYGELIIIKHDSTWLSAYGHNRKRLVKEGQRIAVGDVIAEMGASSANRNALHFEIRRKGKPVNPLDFLPRR